MPDESSLPHAGRFYQALTGAKADLPIAEFLEMRESALQARFMRQSLDSRTWQAFKETLAAAFYKRYKDPIDHTRDVHIAINQGAATIAYVK